MFNLNDFLLSLPLPLIDHWGYLFVFISAMVEALPALGSIFPGQIVVMFGGFLAQTGVLRLGAVILVAAVGSIIGDLIAYIIGWKYGYDFIYRYGKYFFFNQEKYERTKKLVEEHAGKTLIIGRFNSFARAFTPFIVGISRIKFSKFIIYNIIGGISWAFFSVFIGYIFGHGFTTASKYFGRFIIIAVIAIILIIFIYRLLNKRRHIFAKYHVYYLTINAISIYIFSKMIEDYFSKESTYRLDLYLAKNISSIWQSGLNKLMITITDIFSPEILLTVVILASIYYFIKKNWYKASLIFMSSAGGLALGAILKYLIGRIRPLGGLINESGLSFPSQHALMSLIFFTLIIFLFTDKIKNKLLRYLFILSNVILIVLVGFSRIYLKVHYFSDVIAGYALGLFWLTFLILAFTIVIKLYKDREIKKSKLNLNL